MTTMRKQQIILISAIVAVLIVIYLGIAIFASATSCAYPNTFIDSVNVSGKDYEEIKTALRNDAAKRYDDISFDVTVEDITKTVYSSDLSIEIDVDKAAQLALLRNAGGNFFTRPLSFIKALLKREVITTPIKLDDELLAHLISEFSSANVLPIDAGYVIEEDEMTLTPPVDGFVLNEEDFENKLTEKFSLLNDEDITFSLELAKAKPLDLDKVYEEVHAEVSDAKLEIIDGKNVVTPHVVGTDFDLEAAKKAHAASPDSEVVIPLTLVQPKVTTLMIQATLFQDTLSTKTTYYSPKKVNRCVNVRLAANHVNGIILNPGEVFSFNEAVGPRTAARGFKEAGVFSKGELVDGLGGGICQVSSTLYMASIFADLKTVERKNHSFYVDYAPKGQDATVVYGAIDFKFENSTDYPIKILAYAKDNYITVTIKGTRVDKKSVSVKTTTLATKPYTTKTVVDNTLKPDERVVKQAGQPGITMDVYRYVYDASGNLISKRLENKTKYVPMTEIIHVGPSAAVAPSEPPSEPVVSTPEEEIPGNLPIINPESPPPSDTPEQTTVPEEQSPEEQPPAEQSPEEQPPAEQLPEEQPTDTLNENNSAENAVPEE